MPRNEPPRIRSGGVCSGPSATMSAPIFRSGAITRSIGRRERAALPTRRLSNVCPASKPASSRMVVPEFPQSISSLGGTSTRFFPCTMSTSGSGCSILIPKARNALTVCMQSSLGRNPRSVHAPLDNAAMIAARCEMLLSPGTVISVSIRGARLTRNSIDQFNPPQDRAVALRLSGQDYQHPIFDVLVQLRSGQNDYSSVSGRRLFAGYGTRKIFPVYGSFTSVPGGNPSTSTYLPGEKGLSTTCGLPGTGMPYG